MYFSKLFKIQKTEYSSIFFFSYDLSIKETETFIIHYCTDWTQ